MVCNSLNIFLLKMVNLSAFFVVHFFHEEKRKGCLSQSGAAVSSGNFTCLAQA